MSIDTPESTRELRCPIHANGSTSEAVGTARPFRSLSHPHGWPIVGQLPGFDSTRTHLILERWAKEHGTPYRFSMGPGYDALVFDDPEVAQSISRRRPEAFTRGGRMQPVMSELGFNGVFSAEGEAWRTQRKLVMGALNASHLKGWLPTLQEITARLERRWRQAALDRRVLQMTNELKRYTVDVTSALAFGRDPRTIDHDGLGSGDTVQDHLEHIFPAIIRRVMTPFSYWKWFKLPADQRLDTAVAAVKEYAHDCIAQARSNLGSADFAAPRHVLESMLLHQQSMDLSDEDIVANIVTLLLGGEDTTAHSLAWCMFYLAQDKSIQERYASIAQDLLDGANGTLDASVLAALAPLDALASESMRLRPVVPLNVFEPVKDTVVDGVAVAARTKLFFLSRPSMLDAKRFASPNEFRPSRWSADAAPGEVDSRAFLPFGVGARVCPGRTLANAEIRLVLAMLLRRFRVELACSPNEIEEINALTMLPSKMPIRLIER
jgi:cytochrome P450